MLNCWRRVVFEQLQLLIYSGLYNKTDVINISCVGSEEQKQYLEKLISNHDKFKIIYYNSNISVAEVPILQLMQNHCYKNPDEFLIWYMHTKGVISGTEGWRLGMERFVIHQHEHCAKTLLSNNFGACGGMFRIGGFTTLNLQQFGAEGCHFSGNFWWAKASYIRSIKYEILDMWRRTNYNRYIAEAFIGITPNPRDELFEIGATEILDNEFDEVFYKTNNPSFVGSAFSHFLSHGRLYGFKFKFDPERLCNLVEADDIISHRKNLNNPGLEFDVDYYIKENVDVANNWNRPAFEHFIRNGIYENRPVRWKPK